MERRRFRYRAAHHVSDSMPCRGIAYQPRVPTLGIPPLKQTRVLKERRVFFVSRTLPPTHCEFEARHTHSFRD